MSILTHIQSHDDLVQLSNEQREELCGEIRQFLISSVSKTGGHLAGNLGTVELSVAIETVFDTRVDRLVFDVGHQSYVHKLLTGRQADFAHLRQFGGMSGYPRPAESPADSFVAGHASSSVSIALGMAKARTMLGKNYSVIALTGDGAATGGMIYEGLNNLADSGEPMIVILNDNEMAIARNVGGMSRHLSRIRSSTEYLEAKRRYRNFLYSVPGGHGVYAFTRKIKNRVKNALLPNTLFQNMGLEYLGPADGHDVNNLVELLENARNLHEPVLVHVVTRKGKGYSFAEADPARFHGIGKFDPETGKTLGTKKKTYSDSFGEVICELAEKDSRVCAVTAAMPGGTGLVPFSQKFPCRYTDVGIAEEHGVSMCGGLAKQGAIPVFAIYSTFLQRGYDQMLQDVALLHLHVVFAIDRAGLVGDDGPTHHGVFDVGFLSQIPGMLILNPASLREQQDMLRWAVEDYDGPVAVRYPRGTEGSYHGSAWENFPQVQKTGAAVSHVTGSDILLITYGSMLDNVLEAAKLLREQGIEAGVLRLMTLSALPMEEIRKALPAGRRVMVVEEACSGSGVRDRLETALHSLEPETQVEGMDLGPDFVPHGEIQKLYEYCGLDAASIAARVKEMLES